MSSADLSEAKHRRSWKMLLFEVMIVAAFLAIAVLGVLAVLDGPWTQGRNCTKSLNNLRQISLAIIQYTDTHKHLPPPVVFSPEGKPLYSWRVLLLPFLGEDNLHGRFHLDEPWDSTHNKQFLSRIPSVYAPVRRAALPGDTYYQVFVGPGTAFEGVRPLRYPDDFPDGASKTLLVVEAGEPVPWTKPGDLLYDPVKPLPALGGLFRDRFNCAFADCSVFAMPRQTSEETIRALITRNGGEKVELPEP
jgi:hypothetical protein